MRTRIIEYVHEYDEQDWKYGPEGEKIEYTSHVEETHYAVRNPGYTWTVADDPETGSPTDLSAGSWQVNGTTLTVYGREDINGIINLLTKIRDEAFPKEPKKEIETFGD